MCLKKKIAGIIEVEEIHDVIDVGTTMPVRCRLENGMNVVVKYMKNPFGQIVLINDLIGSCIADVVGVNNPEYGICNLSEEVIINSNCNEEIDLRNAGLAFYTKEYSSTIPPSMSMLSLVENKETEKIELVIKFEQWEEGKLYDRMGLENETYEILGLHIPAITVPVRPGRNLAAILEIAAMNQRLKKMGYNTAEEFNKKLEEEYLNGDKN